MEFLDKLGQKASEAYKVTADKTGKLAKEAKLRIKMGELKSQINEIYEEIGKKVYENHVREEKTNIENELEEECTKIDVISAEIESNLKQCLELKDKRQCPQCYKEIDKEMKFCPECGAKQEQSEEAKEVEIVEPNNEKEQTQSNEQQGEKTNLEQTVEIESNVNLDDDETVQEIKYEEE